LTNPREGYLSLMEAFINQTISARDFERRYVEKFKNESGSLDESTYQVLDEVFGDVDAFEPDESLRRELEAEDPGYYLDEVRLKERVQAAVARLTGKM
jgi:hypothetical protein